MLFNYLLPQSIVFYYRLLLSDDALFKTIGSLIKQPLYWTSSSRAECRPKTYNSTFLFHHRDEEGKENEEQSSQTAHQRTHARLEQIEREEELNTLERYFKAIQYF